MIKRPEVWFLALLALGSLAFALWPAGPADSEGKAEVLASIQPAQAPQAAQLIHCKLVRDHGNARLDIELQVTNAEPRPLLLVKPAVRLLAEADREVPPFILPTERAPELAAQSYAHATLRYWLEKADLKGALTLEVQGSKLPVKSAKPFDLEKLTNDQPKAMPLGGDW